MAKQRIVLKVTTNDDKKSRKAMKITVSVPGVESVAFIGSGKEQIQVTGEGIDSVELTKLLRKNIGHTDIVSVGLIREKKPVRFEYVNPQHYGTRIGIIPLQAVQEVPSDFCTIL